MSHATPSHRAPARPVSLAQAIQQGGPLAKLFHDAARQERQAVKTLLEGQWVQALLPELRNDAAERVATGVGQSPLKVLHACEPGCSACCRNVAVDVTPLEAFVVADYLRANLDAPQREAVTARLAVNAQARSQMSANELRRVRLTCAFLNEQGRCSVYAARPLACAGAFSMSRQACHLAAEQPASPAAQQVPFDPYTKTWTMGVSGGLQRALVEAGLDGNLYELSSAVLRALETPDAVERWLRREDVFHGCTCTDAHSPPRVNRAA